MAEGMSEGPKAAREMTLTERVTEAEAIIKHQHLDLELLKDRTNELRRQLRKVIPDFAFDDEPQEKETTERQVRHGVVDRPGHEGRFG